MKVHTWLKKRAKWASSTALSISASSQIIKGDFPPSSKVHGLRLLFAANSCTILPVSVDPVKAICKWKHWIINFYTNEHNKKYSKNILILIIYLINIHMASKSCSCSWTKSWNYIKNTWRKTRLQIKAHLTTFFFAVICDSKNQQIKGVVIFPINKKIMVPHGAIVQHKEQSMEFVQLFLEQWCCHKQGQDRLSKQT